jgi:hypothetical protein
MGGKGGVVEVDETIYGRNYSRPRGRARGKGYYNAINKNVILSHVKRGGEVRSYHVEARRKLEKAATTPPQKSAQKRGRK